MSTLVRPSMSDLSFNELIETAAKRFEELNAQTGAGIELAKTPEALIESLRMLHRSINVSAIPPECVHKERLEKATFRARLQLQAFIRRAKALDTQMKVDRS